MKGKRICLITSAHIAYNPRLVKEADALDAMGCDVRVVGMNVELEKWELDQSLMATRRWKLEVVTARRNGEGHGRWLRAALRQKWSQRAERVITSDGCRLRAFSRFAPELAQLAAREPADLFLAHNLPALPAAERAARYWGAKLGYDAEDFHTGMQHFNVRPSREAELAGDIEKEYLPRCDHLTAASPGVADAVVELCGCRRPVPILNVFPLGDRPTQRSIRVAGRPLKLYWFSQVVGPDRGLEDAVLALGMLLPGSAELHLRGRCDETARGYLDKLIAETGVASRAVIVHAPESPNLLVGLAAEHDVGLALEVPVSQNRIICMNDLCTNKVFTYLMAGLAVAASAMGDGQVIFDGAGFSYRTGDATALAAGLRRWLDDPATLQSAKDKAWELASARYSWEFEQKAFLSAVERTLQ